MQSYPSSTPQVSPAAVNGSFDISQDALTHRAAWVEIDVGAIRHNLRLIRKLAGRARVYVVCKGDAYGFDAVTIARLAVEERLDALACGDPDDARLIREAGVTVPILLYASTVATDLPSMASLDVIVTAHDAATLAVCIANKLAFSVKLDSGFNRLGFRHQDLDVVLETARENPDARVQGVYTHLADTDVPSSVANQVARFHAMTARIDAAGWKGLERMVASSRVLIAAPHLSLDAVNPGRLVYGLFEEEQWHDLADSRSALAAVKARIIALKRVAASSAPLSVGDSSARDTVLAIIPLGFADGYPRAPAGGTALVRGQRVPLVGYRHTEHSILDVTDVASVALGDEVVLLGTQGEEHIGIQDLVIATGVPLLELASRLARNPHRKVIS